MMDPIRRNILATGAAATAVAAAPQVFAQQAGQGTTKFYENIYFTDPGPRPIMLGRPTYVYYLSAGAKEPILIDDRNPRPMG
jgi:hypothetical protein